MLSTVNPPGTYREWLDCFELLSGHVRVDEQLLDAISEGDFTGSPQMKSALLTRLTETVNTMLDMRIRSFIRYINECIAFNELEFLVRAFRELKSGTDQVLILAELRFLEPELRTQLADSIKAQVGEFVDKVIRQLRENAENYPGTALEDALYLIERINFQ